MKGSKHERVYLTANQSYIRDDNHGFKLVFLDPNYGFAVDS